MSARRRRCVIAIVATATMASSACGARRVTVANEVRAALDRTSASSRGLVYKLQEGTRTVVVRAQVEDDLRYKADLSVDGVAGLEEVAVDDTLADRVVDDSVERLVVRPGATVPADLSAAVDAHQWVTDPEGAPSLLPSATAKRTPGDDPVLDAVTVLRHVRKELDDAGGAHRFNPDSLDYRPQEDPFPRPDKGAGVVRYDFERPRLPRPEDAIAGQARALPGPANFRRVSVYVQHGRVVQVLETMDVATRLRELGRLYDLGLPPKATTAEAVRLVVTRLNQLRLGTGLEPIRLQTMSVQLVGIGSAVHVAVPGGGVSGSLAFLRNRGASKSS